MEKLKNYGISLFVGYLLIIIMFLITSCIFAYTNIQDKYLDIGIYISLFLACAISSVILGKKNKKKAILSGIIFGAIFYGLVFICSCIISGFNFSLSIAIYFLISIISSIIGNIIGVSI